jgi:hypothetical protein
MIGSAIHCLPKTSHDRFLFRELPVNHSLILHVHFFNSERTPASLAQAFERDRSLRLMPSFPVSRTGYRRFLDQIN